MEGREAIRICDACPIEQFCHDFAERNDEVGIWGGYPFGLVVEGRKGDRLVAKLRPKGRPKQYQPGIDREMQVADLLAEGYGPHEISKKLDITLRTVQRHVRQLRERGEAA